MINMDKSAYLNYAKDIENKVNSLCANISLSALPDATKQDIKNTRLKISTITFLITDLAKREIGTIPYSDWKKYQDDINELYNHLSHTIQQSITHSQSTAITR